MSKKVSIKFIPLGEPDTVTAGQFKQKVGDIIQG